MKKYKFIEENQIKSAFYFYECKYGNNKWKSEVC